ncbi:MAG: 6-phosphogluconolactonase [Microbacteriaceae bacterium]|nr:6-phosphogluconolactonase [Microbacteriaceae bacterium]
MTVVRRVLVHSDKQALAEAVGARFLSKVAELLEQQQLVSVVLTGGSVGIGVLAAIADSPARDSVDWSRVSLWWGDERWLPAGDAERNDKQAKDALLDQIALLPSHVHRFAASDAGLDLDAAAFAYAQQLATAATDGSKQPRFDIAFLGVGPDGHVASLFPHYPGIQVTDTSVVPVRDSPKPPPDRLSLTLPTLNSADRIWLVLAGADKASALGLALAGASALEVPVAGVEGRMRTVFFVDEDAAAEVPAELIAAEY